MDFDGSSPVSEVFQAVRIEENGVLDQRTGEYVSYLISSALKDPRNEFNGDESFISQHAKKDTLITYWNSNKT